MTEELKYEFRWELLGDIKAGRPEIGQDMPVLVYRLMQFTLRDALEKRFGTTATDELFYAAGKLAAQHLYANVIGEVGDFSDFVRKLQATLKDLKVGIMRIEQADLTRGEVTLTVSEDLDCSGLPDLSYEICTYDEGFISGLLEGYTGKAFTVKEVDCWCTGDRTCRFKATANTPAA